MPVGSYALLKVKATPIVASRRFFDFISETPVRTTKLRNRLILELMARGGMRIGEVLKLTPHDVQDRKLVIRDPKSGKEQVVIFIPQKVSDRLKEYIRAKNFNSHDRIFQIGYEAARKMVRKAGEMVRISLRPHDLRRNSATYASRSNVPIEVSAPRWSGNCK